MRNINKRSHLFEREYNSALKFLSYRPRSEQEIREKLKSKKAPEEIIEKIISKLKEHKFLDDAEFTRWWIESRTNFKPRSMRLIKIELKGKGIADDIIDEIFNFQFSIFNETEMAKKLIRKKIKKYQTLPKLEIYQKLGRFLASKGFNWETIKQSIDEVLENGV
ncbi:MAG: regulatory protein RecX [Candidatus Levyibacteriota bacterium]